MLAWLACSWFKNYSYVVNYYSVILLKTVYVTWPRKSTNISILLIRVTTEFVKHLLKLVLIHAYYQAICHQ